MSFSAPRSSRSARSARPARSSEGRGTWGRPSNSARAGGKTKNRWSTEEKAIARQRREGDGRNERRPVEGRHSRNDSGRSFGNRDERRSFGNRDDRRSFGNRDDRRTFNKGEDRRTFGSNRDDRRDFAARDDRRSFEGRDDRRSYGNRDDRRSVSNREDRRDFKPRNDNRDFSRTEGRGFDRREDRRDFKPRDDRRSFGDRDDRRSFNDRDDRRSFSNRDDRRDFQPRNENRGFESRDRNERRSFDNSERRSFDNTERTPRPMTVEEHAPLEGGMVTAADVAGRTFGDLGLDRRIVGALHELGAAEPFPIQAATIPDVIAGRDVLGRGRTGSGKTIAFGAPLVQLLADTRGGDRRKPAKFGRAPRALILAPTRELAQQIDRTVQPLAKSMGLFTVQIYGGVRQDRQVQALRRGVDVVVGTPGRIEDLHEQGRLDLSEVSITVLDEADLMCEFGFLEPVQRILRHCADGGQRMLFSATLDKQVSALVQEFLTDPATSQVEDSDDGSGTIEHRGLVVHPNDRDDILVESLAESQRALVFAKTRLGAERIADQLSASGIAATSLHGNLSQGQRNRNLASVASGKNRVLVATDVAARGIHLDDVDLVVQVDLPHDHKTYLHRAGRTGRAGREGTVITFVPRNRRRSVQAMYDKAEVSAELIDAGRGPSQRGPRAQAGRRDY